MTRERLSMQNPASERRRILLPRTTVNSGGAAAKDRACCPLFFLGGPQITRLGDAWGSREVHHWGESGPQREGVRT